MNLGKMKWVKTYEEYKADVEEIDEGLRDSLSAALKKGSDFAREVWSGVKRESRETQEAVRLIGELLKGNSITDTQKKFIKAQSVDLVKALPLIAIQGIPVPVPITPFLILLGKKVGIDILPDSHKKVDYEF
jgi:hypothetical protein